LSLIFGLAASSAAVVLLGGSMALRARRRPVVSGQEEMTGAVGEVLAVDNGVTWALVHGERWKVRSADALAPGQRVRVLALRGLTLDVRPEDSDSDPTPKGTSS
jgi:membrane-bound serine protease (ClpP class)